MRIGELKELIEDLDDDMEVRYMGQPAWPFEYSIRKGVTSDELPGFKPEGSEEFDGDDDTVFYLAEGNQLAYGTSAIWD